MKLYVILFAVILISLVSCDSKPKYSPDRFLNEKEQSQLLYTTIRYLGHLPKKGTYENKFNSEFDEYYSKLVLDFDIEAYHKKGDYEYFLTSRIAPSIKVKKVAVGVKIKRNEIGELTYYEEIFRTWKFEVPEMLEKGTMLFDKMVTGEDLSPYYNANSEEEYIEFPDGKVQFDVDQRRWVLNGESESITQR